MAETPRADFERREPRCRICRDETVRVLVNKMRVIPRVTPQVVELPRGSVCATGLC